MQIIIIKLSYLSIKLRTITTFIYLLILNKYNFLKDLTNKVKALKPVAPFNEPSEIGHQNKFIEVNSKIKEYLDTVLITITFC